MKIFNAADFGIVPNEDISEKLAEFISALKAEDGEKTAVFDSGTIISTASAARIYARYHQHRWGIGVFARRKAASQRRSVLFRRRVGSYF